MRSAPVQIQLFGQRRCRVIRTILGGLFFLQIVAKDVTNLRLYIYISQYLDKLVFSCARTGEKQRVVYCALCD